MCAHILGTPKDAYFQLQDFAKSEKVKTALVLRAMIPLAIRSLGKDISKEITSKAKDVKISKLLAERKDIDVKIAAIKK